MTNWRKVPGWDCRDGTQEEDHDWHLVPGDSSVGEGDQMECWQCGKSRDATKAEVRDSYCDYDGTLIRTTAAATIQAKAEKLVDEAAELGLVLTIERVPPLTSGPYETVIAVRLAHWLTLC